MDKIKLLVKHHHEIVEYCKTLLQMNKEPLPKYPFFCQLHNNGNSIKSNKTKGAKLTLSK